MGISKLTRERLEALANAEYCKSNPGAWLLGLKEVNELARMALAAMDSEPQTDDELSNLLWYSQEATCHSDPNYYCEFQRLATPGLIAGIIRELQERRKADSEPVAYISKADFDAGYPHILARRDFNKACTMPVYAAPQPAPVVPDDFRDAMSDLLAVLDEYPEQLVPINRDSAVVRACRAAMLNQAPVKQPSSNGKSELLQRAEKLAEETAALAQRVQWKDLRATVRAEHAEWAQATFGNTGPVGPLKHLSAEALEAAAEPHDLSEWADMQFLFWDAQRRAGVTDEQITAAMVEKLEINKARQWPEPKDGEPRFHIK